MAQVRSQELPRSLLGTDAAERGHDIAVLMHAIQIAQICIVQARRDEALREEAVDHRRSRAIISVIGEKPIAA
jgi:hypothetical protein